MEKFIFPEGDKSNPMPFITATAHFFGLREGQTKADFFKEEIKPLSAQDRDEIRVGLKDNGYTITDSKLVQ